MDLPNSIQIAWSLIAANIVQILIIIGLGFYIYRIRKKLSHIVYHQGIKRPFVQLKLNIRKNRELRGPTTPEEIANYHNSSFDISDVTSNPYANTQLLSLEAKRKFCKQKIKDVKTRVNEYYIYTNGRIKPEDLYEFVIYRTELSKHITNANDYKFERD